MKQQRADSVAWEQYMLNLRQLMQDATKETQRQDALWNRLNDEINDYLDRSNITDTKQRASIKASAIRLNDAYQAGMWWRGKAQYLAGVISAECAMRDWGL